MRTGKNQQFFAKGGEPICKTAMTDADFSADIDRPIGRPGFTLIELLVVISIIGLLAGLTVGLTGVASRKGKEARIKAELNNLETAIESYIAAVGAPPPDNPGKPSTNQLYYELSGTTFQQNKYTAVGSGDAISSGDVLNYFGQNGIANAARDTNDVKFHQAFKPVQHGQFKPTAAASPTFEVLAVPVPGPTDSIYLNTSFKLSIPAIKGGSINPWMYDSSSKNRNNRNKNGYDLWTEVVIGKHTIRFSNWENSPVVVK